MASAIAVVIVAFYRPLLFKTFDPEVADVSGVNTARIDALQMLLLTFAGLTSMKLLRSTLIAAALVIPPTVARLLTKSFKRMLIISTSIGGVGVGDGEEETRPARGKHARRWRRPGRGRFAGRP